MADVSPDIQSYSPGIQRREPILRPPGSSTLLTKPLLPNTVRMGSSEGSSFAASPQLRGEVIGKPLSPRETEALGLASQIIAEGRSRFLPDVAARLGISRTHARNLLVGARHKLDASSTSEAADIARKVGVIKTDKSRKLPVQFNVSRLSLLLPSELKVYAMIADSNPDLTYVEMAKALGIKSQTFKQHASNIWKKLGIDRGQVSRFKAEVDKQKKEGQATYLGKERQSIETADLEDGEIVAGKELDVDNPFTIWLIREMKRRNKTGRGLSDVSGVDHTTISRLLKGDRDPTLDVLSRLLNYFDDGQDEGFDKRFMDMLAGKSDLGEKAFIQNLPFSIGVLSGTVSQQIDQYITFSKLTGTNFARLLGIDKSTITRVRADVDRKLTLKVFSKVTRGLNLDIFQIKGILKAAEKGSLSVEEAIKLSEERETKESNPEPMIMQQINPSKNGHPMEPISKPEVARDLIWLNVTDLNSDLLKQIIEIYKRVFGSVPEGFDDYEDPAALEDYRQKILEDLFGEKGLGFAEHDLLEVVRLSNEKGNFLRFKSSPDARKKLRDEFQKLTDQLIIEKGISISSSGAIGVPLYERLSSGLVNFRQDNAERSGKIIEDDEVSLNSGDGEAKEEGRAA